VDGLFDTFRIKAQAGDMVPRDLRGPADYEQEILNHWFRRKQELYGWQLPIILADLRLRPFEMTLFVGDNGSGKSSFLSQTAIELGMQEAKVCIASLEMHPATTFWIMGRQLLGAKTGYLEETPENVDMIIKTVRWIQQRVRVYDFRGIGQWQNILDTFQYARRELGFDAFILDSVMMVGIPDDDYAQQGLAAKSFEQFCIREGAHTVLVCHENKGDGSQKQKVRGSKQWTDAAHVVMALRRNEEKELKLEENQWKYDQQKRSEPEYLKIKAELLKDSDAKLTLHKQRWPGSRQNGSRHLWFDHASLQFRDKIDDPPLRYIE
jgi:KaiC/GvpD/RAD55 family RecA-like ATPase